MIHLPRARTTTLALCLTVAMGCEAGSIDDTGDEVAEVPGFDVTDDVAPTLDATNEVLGETQAFIHTTNGMRAINGLRSRNGLMSLNGLTTENGITTVNGIRMVNGLRTRNGKRAFNGLSIDCTGAKLGETCSGDPDGLLDAATGLMSSPEGVETASYVIRCALPARDSIRIVNYDGDLVTLGGELGLAPQWKDSQCDLTCQERVSACLMALTNGDGNHIELELSAPFTLGLGHSPDFPFQEAAFFGNIFVDPPQAFYCVGKDYASSGLQIRLLETRACEGYNERDGSCPYVWAGYCGSAYSLNPFDRTIFSDNRCRFEGARSSSRSGDTAASCVGGSSFNAKTWSNPITTFRDVRE